MSFDAKYICIYEKLQKMKMKIQVHKRKFYEMVDRKQLEAPQVSYLPFYRNYLRVFLLIFIFLKLFIETPVPILASKDIAIIK